MTVPEGLTDSRFPCAEVLSVAGFPVFPLLFPLGERVIPEEIYLLVNLGFEHILNILDSYSRSVRRCQILNFNHINRGQAAQSGTCEQHTQGDRKES